MTGECPYLSQLLVICDWWQQARLPGWCWIIRSSWFSYGSSDRANLSIDLGNNALPAWVKGAWAEYSHSQKGATWQVCEQQREGFRKCDGKRTNFSVSWMWHIKLNKGCEVGWSLGRDWWPSCSHSSSGSFYEECSINNLADWSHTVKCVRFYVLMLSTSDYTVSSPFVLPLSSKWKWEC